MLWVDAMASTSVLEWKSTSRRRITPDGLRTIYQRVLGPRSLTAHSQANCISMELSCGLERKPRTAFKRRQPDHALRTNLAPKDECCVHLYLQRLSRTAVVGGLRPLSPHLSTAISAPEQNPCIYIALKFQMLLLSTQ